MLFLRFFLKVSLNYGNCPKILRKVSSKIAKDIDTLWMGYMNPFYHYGMEKILQKADEYNIQGTIIPDLPYEMAKDYEDLFNKYNRLCIELFSSLC